MNPCAANPFEIENVCWAIKTVEPRNAYLEIGSFRGGSLRRYGGQMCRGARLVAVDRPLCKAGIREDLSGAIDDMRASGFDAVWIEGDSHDLNIVASVREAAPLVDVLFIDGDHSAEGVNADVANYVPLVRPGGLVVFHDIGPCDWTVDGKAAPIFDGCFAAWKALAEKHARKMVVQGKSGYGFVWID